ncbi:MAG: methylenetetrahydrofolate--tRNA-(uracil(54)-C(5))-methyltransferase (FADH(2)-oxidizing) TrmFO [Oscillospiraceae bacterium]|nr:methylenetetrahydrofolate--tRNA-(uracil(54)-C(5))-methyltransferase (FADH(2)-oxidizing) TrmFO [Oscillospiraceae bacterium]
MEQVRVIGAGLAGCEAAWTIAEAGIPVLLIDMKPDRRTPAHRSDGFAELVCSNSLKAERVGSAAGLLKEEMRRLGSLLVPLAYQARVPAGGALAVDRDIFSRLVTQAIREHPLIEVRQELVEEIPSEGYTVIATGPLTQPPLDEAILRLCGGALSFYDAAAPIISAESIDRTKVFAASRYEKGEPEDYLNCPFNKEEYEAFISALLEGETVQLHEFEQTPFQVYEGCMPIEVLAGRGRDAARFGPMKPVGLRDPRTGKRPWAVVQLRKENTQGTLYNLVGFQTNLKFPEQRRIFSMIPGLEQAEFHRYGVMHRNTFLRSPGFLDEQFRCISHPHLWFAGQMTGVEGYMESAASGLVAGIGVVRHLKGFSPLSLPPETMIGALSRYISQPEARDFQPMGANMGILPPLEDRIRDKQLRYEAIAQRGLAAFEDSVSRQGILSRPHPSL